MRPLDCKGRPISRDKVFTNAPRSKARHRVRLATEDPEARRDAMRGVVHWRQPRPTVRPSLHILVMAALQKLDRAKLTPSIEFASEQVLAGVEHRLRHHVLEAGLSDEFHDLLALVERQRHRDRAHNVLSSS